MSTEFWAIIGVGVAVVGMFWSLRGEMSGIRHEITTLHYEVGHIRGWIEGRFKGDT